MKASCTAVKGWNEAIAGEIPLEERGVRQGENEQAQM